MRMLPVLLCLVMLLTTVQAQDDQPLIAVPGITECDLDDRVVSCIRTVHLIGTDGKLINTIETPTSFDPGTLSWSADGRYLIGFTHEGLFRIEVKTMVIEDITPSTTPPDAELFPKWSPVTDEIAYLIDPDANDSQRWERHLMLADGDGTNTRLLTEDLYPGFYFTWSPDGERIAVVAGEASETLTAEREHPDALYIVQMDGSGDVRVDVDAPVFHVEDDGWSPDGTRFVFSTGLAMDEVHVLDVAMGQVERLELATSHSKTHFRWSSDGNYLFYHTWDENDEEVPQAIRRMDMRTGEAITLVEHPFIGGYDLSPAGDQLVYTHTTKASPRADDTRETAVCITNIDGTDVKCNAAILASPWSEPRWQPG